MKLSIIVAMTKDRVIGQNNKIPWHYPEDMKWFKYVTTGSIVIMGRKTWESLGSQQLPHRHNIIVSTILADKNNDCDNTGEFRTIFTHSITSALKFSQFLNAKQVWFIGGAQIYKEALDIVKYMWITEVLDKIDGENIVYFPTYDERNWECISCLWGDNHDLLFKHYKRKK